MRIPLPEPCKIKHVYTASLNSPILTDTAQFSTEEGKTVVKPPNGETARLAGLSQRLSELQRAASRPPHPAGERSPAPNAPLGPTPPLSPPRRVGGSQWAQREATVAVPGAERRSPIRAGSGRGARPLVAGAGRGEVPGSSSSAPPLCCQCARLRPPPGSASPRLGGKRGQRAGGGGAR